ncbi:MAG: Txe/YoeB family addiction module toxin [Microcystaceae cyanobacterium]
MKVTFTEAAWDDYLWLQDNDKKLLKRVNLLIKDILRNPTEGIGKPELLKANLSGYLSRRITSEHRLIYGIISEGIIIIACRFHYTL